ncbi:MAG: LamG-like jellyroll fold domain-containing protein [Thermoguttaceae bacterium]
MTNGQIRAADLSSGLADAVDDHTVALWLFDEPQYPNVTLTDAGPLQLDLRLDSGGRTPVADVLEGRRGLVDGKFGRGLSLPIGSGLGVTWPTDYSLGGSSPIPGRGHAVPERCNLGNGDWTIECWFRSQSNQTGRGVFLELRNESPPPDVTANHGFNALLIDAERRQFVLVSKTLKGAPWDFALAIPTDTARLNDGAWHHIAFVFGHDQRQIRHWLDGQVQTLPGKGGFLPLMGVLTSLRIGRDRDGKQELCGVLDELRISDVARYSQDAFIVPGSFSRNQRRRSAPPTAASGPVLLFPPGGTKGPLPLGGRKHVFIDDALLDKNDGLSFVVHPPQKREVTDFRSDRTWDGTPRFGSGVPDIGSIFDDEGELRLFYANGGMFGGKQHVIAVARSKDGLHWEKPELGLVDWDGSSRNNIVMRQVAQGMVFKDPRPDVAANERYKYVAYCMSRGFYVFTSQDGLRWRRNETIALPFDPDGTIAMWWDDQQGRFGAFIRMIGGKRTFRSTALVELDDILTPWPFKPVQKPAFHYTFPLAKPNTGELPEVESFGEVYRHMALKYPHAPDVYLAFPWRYVGKTNIRPGSFLMVSRDGRTWKPYETPYYLPSGWELGGRKVLEALMENGLARRGDELWQFGTVRFTEHGGAHYRGVEHDGPGYDRLLRLTQRLDGFVSLQAGEKPGTALTKSFQFTGKNLTVNVDASGGGSLRVALLDEKETEIAGFGLADCDPVTTDAVCHTVSWKGRTDLGTLSDRSVRLRLELRRAHLYAFQFVEGHRDP